MKALLALLPCAGLAAFGAWWLGQGALAHPPARQALELQPLARPSATGFAPREPQESARRAAAEASSQREEKRESVPPEDWDVAPPADKGRGQRAHDPDLLPVPGFQEESQLVLVQRLEKGTQVLSVEPQAEPMPLEGPWATYHPSGPKQSAGLLRNGKRVGAWTEWYENGQRQSAGDYFHGERHGRWTTWYKNGQMREDGEYIYGRKEGLWTSWYENGQKERVGYYRNDHAEDRATIWYPDGMKAAEGQFSNDLREGLWLEWHESGYLSSRGSYFRGRAGGSWEFWDPDGVLDVGLTGIYEHGRRMAQ